MKRMLYSAAAIAALASCAPKTSPVATVDLARIQANWPKFINYSNQLSADQAAISRSSDSPARKQQELADLRHRFVGMQNEVTNDVRNAAQQVADQRHFSLVVTRQFVGYGGIDITADVEKILKITETPASGS